MKTRGQIDAKDIADVRAVFSEEEMAGAVDTLTIGLSRELAARKIRVNNIAPGGVETEGSITLGMIGSDMEKNIVAQTPLGRIGQPQDIAKIALFLGSDDSAWVTGERIQGSGGLR